VGGPVEFEDLGGGCFGDDDGFGDLVEDVNEGVAFFGGGVEGVDEGLLVVAVGDAACHVDFGGLCFDGGLLGAGAFGDELGVGEAAVVVALGCFVEFFEGGLVGGGVGGDDLGGDIGGEFGFDEVFGHGDEGVGAVFCAGFADADGEVCGLPVESEVGGGAGFLFLDAVRGEMGAGGGVVFECQVVFFGKEGEEVLGRVGCFAGAEVAGVPGVDVEVFFLGVAGEAEEAVDGVAGVLCCDEVFFVCFAALGVHDGLAGGELEVAEDGCFFLVEEEECAGDGAGESFLGGESFEFVGVVGYSGDLGDLSAEFGKIFFAVAFGVGEEGVGVLLEVSGAFDEVFFLGFWCGAGEGALGLVFRHMLHGAKDSGVQVGYAGGSFCR